MSQILIALVLGAIIGYFVKLSDRGTKINGRLQQIGVIFLLFSMGVSIGADSDIIKNLPSIGLKAFLFAVGTIGCSILAVYILSEKFLVNKSKGESKKIKEEVEEIVQ